MIIATIFTFEYAGQKPNSDRVGQNKANAKNAVKTPWPFLGFGFGFIFDLIKLAQVLLFCRLKWTQYNIAKVCFFKYQQPMD